MASGSPTAEDRIGKWISIVAIIFLILLCRTGMGARSVRGSQLLDGAHPMMMQKMSANRARAEVLLVSGDAIGGTLHTATRHTRTIEGQSLRLSPALAGDLELIYDAWCRGEHPITRKPRGAYYEIGLFCEGGPRKYVHLYFPIQDIPLAFAELERVVPTLPR